MWKTIFATIIMILPKIIIDTREQKPYSFKGRPCRRKALESGDYSLLGHTKDIIIERKSRHDLYSTLTVRNNLIRFKKELGRLKKVKYWYILIDASATNIMKGNIFSHANGFAVMCLLFELVAEYGGNVIFANNREEAAHIIVAIFTGYINQRGKKYG